MSALKAVKDRLSPLLFRSNIPLILNRNLCRSSILKLLGYSRNLSRTLTWRQKPKPLVAKCLVQFSMQNIFHCDWEFILQAVGEILECPEKESDMIKAPLQEG